MKTLKFVFHQWKLLFRQETMTKLVLLTIVLVIVVTVSPVSVEERRLTLALPSLYAQSGKPRPVSDSEVPDLWRTRRRQSYGFPVTLVLTNEEGKGKYHKLSTFPLGLSKTDWGWDVITPPECGLFLPRTRGVVVLPRHPDGTGAPIVQESLE